MLQWWVDRPAWLRVTLGWLIALAGVLIVLSYIFADDSEMPRDRRGSVTGFMLIGLGLAMAHLGEKSDAEKKGYHF